MVGIPVPSFPRHLSDEPPGSGLGAGSTARIQGGGAGCLAAHVAQARSEPLHRNRKNPQRANLQNGQPGRRLNTHNSSQFNIQFWRITKPTTHPKRSDGASAANPIRPPLGFRENCFQGRRMSRCAGRRICRRSVSQKAFVQTNCREHGAP